jgi:hypothetical protein
MTLAYLLSIRKNSFHHFFRVPRGKTRWGDGGPLKAVAAPLTPRPRGTIYEALPLIFHRPENPILINRFGYHREEQDFIRFNSVSQ